MSRDILQKLRVIKQKRFEKSLENDPNFANIRQICEYVLDKEIKPLRDELLTTIISEVTAFTDNIKDGADGEDGKIGPPGPKGEKGDKGDKPIAGIDYPIPLNGKDGKDADESKIIDAVTKKIPKPKDGYTPIKGVDYFDGIDGAPGKDGSPDTANQIVEKLNTLEEVLDLKVLKGFRTIVSNLKKSINQKGGGLGLPVHETFNGDGTTTSFTLSSRVAANGNAAWIYYQGQFLVKTTHWTISGRTLTLSLTPENGTKIDVTYIRT